jgi:tripartite-type tricarboxylate transporter receptor subunit TctC
MGEKGCPNALNGTFMGYAVKPGTPAAIVEKLEKVFKEACKEKETIESVQKVGAVVENLGSKEAADFIANQYRIWVDLIKAAKIVFPASN